MVRRVVWSYLLGPLRKEKIQLELSFVRDLGIVGSLDCDW